MPLVIEAPTDKQLDYIAGLCADRGLKFPAVVYSKTEASVIISEILRGQVVSIDRRSFSVAVRDPWVAEGGWKWTHNLLGDVEWNTEAQAWLWIAPDGKRQPGMFKTSKAAKSHALRSFS